MISGTAGPLQNPLQSCASENRETSAVRECPQTHGVENHLALSKGGARLQEHLGRAEGICLPGKSWMDCSGRLRRSSLEKRWGKTGQLQTWLRGQGGLCVLSTPKMALGRDWCNFPTHSQSFAGGWTLLKTSCNPSFPEWPNEDQAQGL